MTNASPPAGGIPIAVVGAALAAGVGFLPGISAFDGPATAGELLSLGWPPLGLVAAVVLDRDPRSRLGRVLVALAVLPFAMLLRRAAGARGRRPGVPHRSRLGCGGHGAPPGHRRPDRLGARAHPDRLSRRRMTWFLGWAGLVVAVVVVASRWGGPPSAAVATMLGLWWLAAGLALLATARELRPIDEPLVDATAVGAALLVGGAAGVLMRWGGQQGHIPAPEVTGAVVAAMVCSLVVPGAWWARNHYLERRYGKGSLTPEDVVSITADLRSNADPRALLSRAAATVIAASGHRDATIVLGAEEAEHPGHWVARPLVVAGDRVGTLAIEPLHPEGPEPRQARIVDQLTPTLALVAQAVTFAVQAEHARRDVLRERDDERRRVLSDLHDGIGPLLAGLRMRVQARVRSDPSDWLRDLADELAEVRGELRRVVSGLTPSALDDGDLNTALEQLAASFRDGGADVRLTLGLATTPSRDASVAVYRFVAEGTTNAIRHAAAKRIMVIVHDRANVIEAEVVDDGIGGIFTPGVGLTSLRRRAEDLGGTVRIEAADPRGTRLRLALPQPAVA